MADKNENNLYRIAIGFGDRVLEAIAVIAIALTYPGLASSLPISPALIPIVQLIGGATLGDVLARYRAGQDVSDDEIKSALLEAMDALRLDRKLQGEEFRSQLDQILEQTQILAKVIGVALEYMENSTVQRIVSAIDQAERRWAIDTVQAINGETAKLQNLLPETRYLVDAIYNWSGPQGIAQYISLDALAPEELENLTSRIKRKGLLDPAIARYVQVTSTGSITKSTHTKQYRTDRIFERMPCFILLGEPGAGKSTTLQYYAIEYALKRMKDSAQPVPFLVRIGDWRDGESFSEFLERKWTLGIDINVALFRGDAVLFVDGLNEAGGESRLDELIRWAAGVNRPTHMVLSSRFSLTSEQLNALHLPQVALLPLTDAQVQLYVESQFSQKQAKKFLADIKPKSGVVNRTPFSHLAHNPFSLVALMALYYKDPEAELPRYQGELLQKLTLMLWQREQDRKTLGWVPWDHAMPKYSALAYHFIESGAMNKTREELDDFLTNNLISVGESAGFLSSDIEGIRFRHQLFQEYFAAEELKRGNVWPQLAYTPDSVRRTLDTLPKGFGVFSSSDGTVVMRTETHDVIANRANQKWDHVASLFMGLLEDPLGFLKSLIGIDPWSGARCMAAENIYEPELFKEALRKVLELHSVVDFGETPAAFSEAAKLHSREIKQTLENVAPQSIGACLSIFAFAFPKEASKTIQNWLRSKDQTRFYAALDAVPITRNPEFLSVLQYFSTEQWRKKDENTFFKAALGFNMLKHYIEEDGQNRRTKL